MADALQLSAQRAALIRVQQEAWLVTGGLDVMSDLPVPTSRDAERHDREPLSVTLSLSGKKRRRLSSDVQMTLAELSTIVRAVTEAARTEGAPDG